MRLLLTSSPKTGTGEPLQLAQFGVTLDGLEGSNGVHCAEAICRRSARDFEQVSLSSNERALPAKFLRSDLNPTSSNPASLPARLRNVKGLGVYLLFSGPLTN